MKISQQLLSVLDEYISEKVAEEVKKQFANNQQWRRPKFASRQPQRNPFARLNDRPKFDASGSADNKASFNAPQQNSAPVVNQSEAKPAKDNADVDREMAEIDALIDEFMAKIKKDDQAKNANDTNNFNSVVVEDADVVQTNASAGNTSTNTSTNVSDNSNQTAAASSIVDELPDWEDFILDDESPADNTQAQSETNTASAPKAEQASTDSQSVSLDSLLARVRARQQN